MQTKEKYLFCTEVGQATAFNSSQAETGHLLVVKIWFNENKALTYFLFRTFFLQRFRVVFISSLGRKTLGYSELANEMYKHFLCCSWLDFKTFGCTFLSLWYH